MPSDRLSLLNVISVTRTDDALGGRIDELLVLAQATEVRGIAGANVCILNARVGTIYKDRLAYGLLETSKRGQLTGVLPGEEEGSRGGGNSASEDNEGSRETHGDKLDVC